MWTQLLGALLGGGGAIAGGLANRSQTVKTDQTTNASSSGTSSASSRRYLSPEQSGILGALTGYGSNLLTDPTGALGPTASLLKRGVQRRYDGMPQAVANRTLAYGGDRSGKMGRGLRIAEQAKAGEMADVDARISQMALGRQDQGMELLRSLLGINLGADTTGSESNTSTSRMTGTSTQPGNRAGGAVTSGLSGLMAALALGKYLDGEN